ncbi:helix-turn-helix transcriptional regulator [Macrococcus psychrotolerans]|uniref:Helix-turn-helix transcriptional regulator n=1 Tax=Macrococcus psychrotolerans TaxID=3039389 RepID=A0AAT9P585_9STAP|nr:MULTISPECIES: helix-turn-helix transcriptional regulator [Macrococcus]QYA32282.1 helix-turn-helix domain-containing protein [Macrococcus sp. 19Msa1099]QYA37088.1 helix-turn-helix domain-containing protein [Macrococcus caseolyticus]QYA75796.1 helix-turn-helix domain-containing protein [Macrococcus caseolyticus]
MTINTNLLKSKMALHGMTINDLSNETGLHRDTVSNIINNKTAPSYPAINALYYALNLSPEDGKDIFFGSDLRNKKV